MQCAGALPGVLFLRLYRERSAEFCSRVRGHQREEFLKVFLKKPRKKEEGCGCSGALYTSLPHPSVRRRRGRAAPDTALGSGATSSPSRRKKPGHLAAAAPSAGGGGRAALKACEGGMESAQCAGTDKQRPAVRRAGERHRAVKQRREHPCTPWLGAGAAAARFGARCPGEARREWHCRERGPGAATRGRARTGNGLGQKL